MRNYDKGAFIAGYQAAFALRGMNPDTPVIRGVRQLGLNVPYTVVWNNDHSFTITWEAGGGGGVVLLPDLFPVTLTGAAGFGGNFQWGRCTIDGTMPTITSTGANRIWYSNSIPNGTVVDDVTKCLNSVFFGEIYSSPGVELSMTVSW